MPKPVVRMVVPNLHAGLVLLSCWLPVARTFAELGASSGRAGGMKSPSPAALGSEGVTPTLTCDGR
jgi:hypothetical protein